jgi:hypothetical protein
VRRARAGGVLTTAAGVAIALAVGAAVGFGAGAEVRTGAGATVCTGAGVRGFGARVGAGVGAGARSGAGSGATTPGAGWGDGCGACAAAFVPKPVTASRPDRTTAMREGIAFTVSRPSSAVVTTVRQSVRTVNATAPTVHDPGVPGA